MIIDWTNTEVTGISCIRIEMPNEAKISIFTDNNYGLISTMIIRPNLCNTITSITSKV